MAGRQVRTTKKRPFFKTRAFPFLLRHLAAVGSVVLTRWILDPFQPYLKIQLIVLLFLLPIIASTVWWGMTPGILAGVAAFFIFNYFYIPPYRTLTVYSTTDLITLVIFLIVSLIMSQLIGRAREAVKLAQSREWEATRMYELIAAFVSLQEADKIAQELARQTLDTFGCQAVKVTVSQDLPESFSAVANPEEEITERTPDQVMILRSAREQEGEIQIWRKENFSDKESRLLEAYSVQAALALEKVRLARSERKAKLLEESDQLKTSLLNSVSHELRSPLAAIKASVSSLRSGTVDWKSSDREELLATIEEETDHLNALVGNLLQMSRIESGALKLQKHWNSYEEIVKSATVKMSKQLQNHQLMINLPKNLPLIPTDYVLIEQVFTNLISNSVKYAPVDTPIVITVFTEGEFLHTQVTNQSPAVAEEHLERIFDKFYRITFADRVTGTGLGLSICKGIIEAHGGRIWAENRPEGFTFHFTLPLTLDGALPAIPEETVNE